MSGIVRYLGPYTKCMCLCVCVHALHSQMFNSRQEIDVYDGVYDKKTHEIWPLNSFGTGCVDGDTLQMNVAVLSPAEHHCHSAFCYTFFLIYTALELCWRKGVTIENSAISGYLFGPTCAIVKITAAAAAARAINATIKASMMWKCDRTIRISRPFARTSWLSQIQASIKL